MELVRGLHNLRARHRDCVVAIGNFDGVHLGHQAILRTLRERARVLGVPATVMTFEPTAREYFNPAAPPSRLMRFRDKFTSLQNFGVDRLVVARFNRALAQMSAHAFVEDLLVGGLGVRQVVVGSGFQFGAARDGKLPLLRSMGETLGYGVDEVPPFLLDGERVSSTAIRQALAAGRLDAARRLLGRDYRISGRVMHGQRLGRTLGFPTANIRLHRRVTPLTGIFAVRVGGIAAQRVPAVASLGTRPTVGGGEILLEVNVFDFNGDLYGRYLEIDFVAKLREELKFPDLESLTLQMYDDAARARTILAQGVAA